MFSYKNHGIAPNVGGYRECANPVFLANPNNRLLTLPQSSLRSVRSLNEQRVRPELFTPLQLNSAKGVTAKQ